MMKSFSRKNSDSRIGFEPMNSHYQLDPLTTELHRAPGELGIGYYRYVKMRPAYTDKNMPCVMSLTRGYQKLSGKSDFNRDFSQSQHAFHTFLSMSAIGPIMLEQRNCWLL